MGEVSGEIESAKKQLEDALDRLERHPQRSIRCGDVAELLKLAQRVGDAQTVYAIKAISAVVVEGILKLNEKHEGAIRIFAEAVKAYVDDRVGETKSILKEIQTGWN